MKQFIEQLQKEKGFLTNLSTEDRLAHVNMYAEHFDVEDSPLDIIKGLFTLNKAEALELYEDFTGDAISVDSFETLMNNQ